MAREAAIKAQVRSEAAAAPPGLTSVEARRRLGEFGANTVTEEATPRWRAFLAKFWGPVPWMLEAAIVLQLGLGQYIEAGSRCSASLQHDARLHPGRPGGRSACRTQETARADCPGPPRRRVGQGSGR